MALILLAVNWGAKKISQHPRRDSGPGPDSPYSKDAMFDDPSLSLRSKYAAHSPHLLLATGPLAEGKEAAAVVPPPQQPAFARNDSSNFMIPAFYSCPTRTEVFSPLGSASNRGEGVTWSANPLATSIDTTAAETTVATGAAEPNNYSNSARSGADGNFEHFKQ